MTIHLSRGFIGATTIATVLAAASSLLPTSAFAQTACDAENAVSPEQIVSNTEQRCCGREGTRRQKRCVRRALRAVRNAKNLLSQESFRDTRVSLRSLRSSCDMDAVSVPQCTDESAVTALEMVGTVEDRACDLKYTSDRVKRLKRLRRRVRQARNFFGREFANAVTSELREGKSSCLAGGEESDAGCGRIVDPRDGANVGNVYKLSDHSPGNPVFITHNGARSGTVVSLKGERLDTLRYTGLANPDPVLRHHYRLNKGCRSYPNTFYLKLGSTCYEIDKPCSRID
ncbi:hypothetical protein MRY87_03950 [bacterium]|nr:hypothetical protein [bacterium]